uniref:Large ribosomal subunit protein mL51 n=1 Tax=Salvator merianae TaxID=96440 RepID=A0A8D0BUY2_SALMN
LFGVYDYIGILGDLGTHPKDLIISPRCICKKKMVGDRLFANDYHNLNKKIKFLYRHLNFRHGTITS